MIGRGRQTLRFAGLALLACAGSPLAAQTVQNSSQPATNSAAASPPPASDTIGPRQLRDFNLGGTVTRRAEPAPTPTPPPTTSARPAATAPASRAPATAAAQPRRAAPRQSSPAATAVAPGPSPDAASPGSSTIIAEPIAAPEAAPISPAPLPEGSGGVPSWPWWLAALVLIGAVAFTFWRQRQARRQPVTAGLGEMLERQPAPAPARAEPRTVPAPPSAPRRPASPIADGGIVSRSLMPNLTFQFTPLRAEFDATGAAALSFELVVLNAGSAPARELLVEAMMLNAGPRQDEEIGYFFKNPVGRGDRIAMVPPLGRVTIRSRVPLPAERLSPLEIEGRKLLVPLVAINALYRSANGEGQQSASFLVGRGGEDGGKMAPFSLDRGARAWTGLSTRQHSAGLQR